MPRLRRPHASDREPPAPRLPARHLSVAEATRRHPAAAAPAARRRPGRPLLLLAFVAATAFAVTAVARPRGSGGDGAPPAGDYVRIDAVPVADAAPAAYPDASTGTAVSPCGHDAEGHHNGDNLITMPGISSGAHHSHDYVGNLSTDAASTDRSLAASPTTCRNGDRSSYYWPVLRLVGTGGGEHGPAVLPVSVLVQYRGNAASPVVPMPRFLRVITGDPRALTSDPKPATRTAWSCSGSTDRRTDRYPICPPGGRVVRIFDFPSCWDGRHTDSPNHRTHVVFPAANGVCPAAFYPVPQLHVEVAYDLPPGARYAVDSFPEQHNSPRTDHAGFVDVMTDAQMAAVVGCLNSGRTC
jgi:hypothetical protein